MTGPLDKSDLRRRMTARRAELAVLEPGFPFRLVEIFKSSFALPPGVEIAGYWPKGEEADPRALMSELANKGAALSLPVTVKGEPELLFRRWRPGERLVTGRFGISEPPSDAALASPEIFLVPLLAFDGRGTRLGYGAGHYDATLRKARKVRAITAIGIAYAGQELDEVPGEAHDEPLDAVVTERGVRMFRKAAEP